LIKLTDWLVVLQAAKKLSFYVYELMFNSRG